MGGLAALVALTHCGGLEAGGQTSEEGRPEEPGTRRQEATTRLSFPASLDARVEAASPTRNFGRERKLVADQSPQSESFLRFHVSGVTGLVTRAVLRLYALDGTSRGPLLYLSSGGWTEEGITWNNRPYPPLSGVLDEPGAISSGRWVEYDVTEVVSGNRPYDFALVSLSGNGADFASREHDREELRPQLVLTVDSSCMPRADTQTVLISPTRDGYASQSQPTRHFSDAPELRVDAAPERLETFLEFNFSLPPEWYLSEAMLRLYATDYTPDGPLLYRASDDWQVGLFDWNTRPALVSGPLGDLGLIEPGTWVEYDVSGTVTSGGGYGFGLLPGSTNGVDFVSMDSSEVALRPRLRLTLESERYCTYQGTGGLTGWTRHYGGLGPERLHALASDAQGGFVAAGHFGNAPFPNGTGFALARYTADGTPSWTRQVTTGDVQVRALTMTPLGNILVVGSYSGSPDLGTGPLPAVPPVDEYTLLRALFVAKFSPTGQTEWAHGFVATSVRPSEDSLIYWPVTPEAVATDANGSLIVAGGFHGEVDFGGGPLFAGTRSISSSPAAGGFLAKFSWDGQHLWSKAFEAGSLPARARAVSTDGGGNVFVGGSVSGNADLGDGPVGTAAPFIARYDAAGTLVWKRLWPGVSGEIVGVQPLGPADVAFIANLRGSFTFGGLPYTGGRVDEPHLPSGFFGALSTWGADEWLRPLGSTTVRQLVTGSDGTATFTGHGDEYDLGGGPLGIDTTLGPTPFVARHTSSGMHLWSRAFDRNMEGIGTWPTLHLAQQPGGSVVVGSDFTTPVMLEERTFTPRGSADLLYFQLTP
ncbi:DNRLRE domain-containing protein [Archangium violaceum]|uniref:CBM96 family carbohydrate-binding protein n=1 Tax=Archangium violaceum TaxID=83451 RepID=UPI00193BAC07|nr:DNRLRE domain-containing protein [Archangium violaceum]QRK08455.1 DNRLRE domain-containing protein [Archangium violaceum]